MKILLTTFGSLGDLHPYLALGLALQKRGHEVAIATSPNYREKIEAEGLKFHPMRPDFSVFGSPEDWMPKVMDAKKGTEFVIKHMVLPHLTDSYVDLKRAAIGTDIIIGHPLIYALPIVADKLNMPWISVMLQPITFFSVYDPPVLPGVPLLPLFHGAGPKFYRWFYQQAKNRTRPWMEPVQTLREEIGLDKTTLHPLFEGQYSPLLNLALFSSVVGERQPDWPQNTEITGFLYFDKAGANQELDTDLAKFLDDGEPPIVFTLGSSAVNDPGRFYAESIKAATKIGARAVLLTGKDGTAGLGVPLPDGISAFKYAPYSRLFPRAAAIVHQGGVGTTSQALRAGKPQLIMPYAHDQPDNASRVVKLGVGATLSRAGYNGNRAAAALKKLLQTGDYIQKASDIGKQIRSEDGATRACDAIEAVLKIESVHEMADVA